MSQAPLGTPSHIISASIAKTSGVFQPNSSSKPTYNSSPAESNSSSENQSHSANSTPQSWGLAWDDDNSSAQTSQHSRR